MNVTILFYYVFTAVLVAGVFISWKSGKDIAERTEHLQRDLNKYLKKEHKNELK